MQLYQNKKINYYILKKNYINNIFKHLKNRHQNFNRLFRIINKKKIYQLII